LEGGNDLHRDDHSAKPQRQPRSLPRQILDRSTDRGSSSQVPPNVQNRLRATAANGERWGQPCGSPGHPGPSGLWTAAVSPYAVAAAGDHRSPEREKSVVLGELAPKALTLDRAEALAVLGARPIIVVTRVLRPAVWGPPALC
jgi:hypothetical protein